MDVSQKDPSCFSSQRLGIHVYFILNAENNTVQTKNKSEEIDKI